MRNISRVLSIVVGLGFLAATASSASAVKLSKRYSEPEPRICLTESQVLTKIGSKNQKLVDLVKSCEMGDAECIVGKFKAFQQANNEDNMSYLMLGMLEEFIPLLRRMVEQNLDFAAKSADPEHAGKFAIAKEQLGPMIDIFHELAQYQKEKVNKQ